MRRVAGRVVHDSPRYSPPPPLAATCYWDSNNYYLLPSTPLTPPAATGSPPARSSDSVLHWNVTMGVWGGGTLALRHAATCVQESQVCWEQACLHPMHTKPRPGSGAGAQLPGPGGGARLQARLVAVHNLTLGSGASSWDGNQTQSTVRGKQGQTQFWDR